MTTKAEYLLARYDEEEAIRERTRDDLAPRKESDEWSWVKTSKADIAAKRRIVELYQAHERDVTPYGMRIDNTARFALGHAVDALLSVYAGRDDFPEEWR